MKELIECCKNLIVEAGERLLRQTAVVSAHKTKNDLLTENDLAIERFLMGELAARFPKVNLISEETAANGRLQGVSVVIDPIDGTCNYAVGSPLFGIQLAVFDGEECVASVLYFPVQKQLLFAQKGEGAYWNGERLRVNPNVDSGDGVLLISDY